MTEFFAYLIGIMICSVVSFIAGLWAGIVFRDDIAEEYDRVSPNEHLPDGWSK